MASSSPDTAPPPPKPNVHPIIRNALRISLSSAEYKSLHKRMPSTVKGRTPTPDTFAAIVHAQDKFNENAIRASIRVFLATGLGMKLFAYIVERLSARAKKQVPEAKNVPRSQSPALRLSLSLSLILLLHRLLYRFLTLLRANLRSDDARPFRERNPKTSKALTSKYAPAIGASLAGFALGAYPQSQLRITATIYMATRSLEFVYNALDEKGYLKNKPWWWGSWLLMPLSFGQLFHAFVFDRETEPKWFGDFLLKFAPGYIQQRPEGFPAELHWPDQHDTVDALGKISELKWPAFTSPILHPGNQHPLPAAVDSISPITSPAHPSISALSCALLHPKSPSCLTAFLHQNLLSIPLIARFLTKVFLALSLLKYKSFLSHPLLATNLLSRKILSMTAVLSAAIGSAWGSVCFFNTYLPRSLLPTQRFYLSGAVGGLPFAFLAGSHRSAFLYFFRLAIDSAWKVGVNRGVWRLWKGGDLCLFVASWAVIGALLESRPSTVTGPGLRKAFAWLKGDGFTDPVETAESKKIKKSRTE